MLDSETIDAGVTSLSVQEDSCEQSFSNKRINIQLDDTNFLLWRQQVTLMMRGQGLEAYLDGSVPPLPKLIRNANGENVSNPAYIRFIKQESSLASWLLSTVSPNILPQLVGADTTATIWSTILQLYLILKLKQVF
ncbi:hypothetical protein GQ457_10G000790 [Hibiscus cannabinus]